MQKILRQLLLFTALITVILWPTFSWAKAYDFYVDASYDGSEKDGSKDKPFTSIQDAVQASLSKSEKERNILIKKGEYDEKITLEESVKLYGDDKGKVIFRKTARMKNNTLISNIVISNVTNGMWVEAGANASIIGCEIKNFKGTGIWTELGSGRLVVKNSKISDGAGKGLYIQEGREIEIVDNIISDNDQEGLDVRARVSGKISGNKIKDNGESGIEFIVGNADLSIEENSIEGNGASGIASQFYWDARKTGQISLANNDLSDNRKYGLDCNSPHSKDPVPASYWSQSMTLIGNLLEGNGIDPINKLCFVTNIIKQEEEKKDNKIVDANLSQEEEQKQEAVIETQSDVAASQEVTYEEKALENELEAMSQSVEALLFDFESSEIVLRSRGNVFTFMIGPDFKRLNALEEAAQTLNSQKEKLEEMLLRSQIDENRAEIRKLMGQLEDQEEKQKELVEEYENKFSLFGWLVKWLI